MTSNSMIVYAEQSLTSDTNSVSVERSIRDCINVTTCSDSEHQFMCPTLNSLSVNNIYSSEKSSSFSNDSQYICSYDLSSKGINIGHLNVQGICGDRMSKFSEITSKLTSPVNKTLHIFEMSETKLKDHKLKVQMTKIYVPVSSLQI